MTSTDAAGQAEAIRARYAIELLSIAATTLGLHGAFLSWVSSVNLNALGYLIVGLFAVSWLLALAIWGSVGIDVVSVTRFRGRVVRAGGEG